MNFFSNGLAVDLEAAYKTLADYIENAEKNNQWPVDFDDEIKYHIAIDCLAQIELTIVGIDHVESLLSNRTKPSNFVELLTKDKKASIEKLMMFMSQFESSEEGE